MTVGQVRHIADRSVLRAGDAEPDRAGRDLRPSRGAARPLHVQGVRHATRASREERQIAKQTTGIDDRRASSTVLSSTDEVLDLQRIVRQVPVTDHVVDYALALVRQTRVGEEGVPDFINEWLRWGAGPRAVQYLLLGGKARALLERPDLRFDRRHCGAGGPRAAAPHRHELLGRKRRGDARPGDRAAGSETTPAKEGELTSDPRFQKIFAA